MFRGFEAVHSACQSVACTLRCTACSSNASGRCTQQERSAAPPPLRHRRLLRCNAASSSSAVRQRRRRPLVPAALASGASGSGSDEESAEAAFAAVELCMGRFLARVASSDLDSIVEYLPEAVIDRLLERKAAQRKEQTGEPGGWQQQQQQEAPGQCLSFDELVALAQPTDLVLDSYSSRGVLYAAPRSAAPLSSLKLESDRFLQRYEVVAQSGEEMILTFDMQLQEALVPKYRGLQVVKKWFLKGITGEPAYPGELPAKPEPCWGPEAVVEAQLAALREGDAGGVFRFASPGNQSVTGPVERFAQMLQAPQYRPLLGHLSADLLRSVQMQPSLAMLIVGVRSNIPTAEPGVTQRAVYSWTVRLQEEKSCYGCWMTESVQPLSQSLYKM